MTTDGQPVDDSGPLAPLSDARLALLNERFDEAVHDLWDLTESPVDGDGLDEYDTVRQCWDELLALLAKRREREAALLHLSTVALDNRQRREAALLAERERLLAENAELRSIASCLPVMYGAFQERHGERA